MKWKFNVNLAIHLDRVAGRPTGARGRGGGARLVLPPGGGRWKYCVVVVLGGAA